MNAVSYCYKVRFFLLSRTEDYLFCMNDLEELAPYDSIRREVADLAKRGLISRICQGVYWVNRSGLETPDPDEIAATIARSNNWVIVPGTPLARFKLGLSDEFPRVPGYLSTGHTKTFYSPDGIPRIAFQHSSGKFLFFANARTSLLISALMDQQRHPTTPQEILHLSGTLSAEDKAIIMKDREFINPRIRPIIDVICR